VGKERNTKRLKDGRHVYVDNGHRVYTTAEIEENNRRWREKERRVCAENDMSWKTAVHPCHREE